MKRRTWVLALGVAVMGSLVQAQSSMIAFSSDRASTDFDILVMKESGEAQTPVTFEDAAARRPSIVFDGTKIVYDDHDNLFMYDGTTDPPTVPNLTAFPSPAAALCGDKAGGRGCEDADVGPRVQGGLQDGDFLLVFTHETKEAAGAGQSPGARVANLWLGRVDVSEGQLVDLVQLTFSATCADPIHYQAAWCGGSHIVWSREIGDACSANLYFWEICTMPINVLEPTPIGPVTCQLTTSGSPNYQKANQYPSCNQNGTMEDRMIAFAQSDGLQEERPHDICTIAFDDLEEGVPFCFVNLDDPDNIYDDTRPSWSPSGTVLAFASNRPDGGDSPDYEIWVMNADGQGVPQQRTTNEVPDDDPDYGAGRLH